VQTTWNFRGRLIPRQDGVVMRRKPSAKVASAAVTHTRLAIEDELR
jgi:glutathione peroxidase-family protein